ncbi:YihY/virulence factor BrkB family protein [Spiribacter halobius]|uniref:Ribonuclease BN n=1 Tax=Sediminicurvatus halobius TaxID=2182432 RepID=A0A2U2N0K1_9GAMM|nr:YihY/virulence factor BrkB family protein [Spiribacter halobius]PWG62598.1 ribonuclease BN [Spiribacter halobius]UEX78484.1 YihY/virulence factor BrkB family protein [Spiribacter halobius]
MRLETLDDWFRSHVLEVDSRQQPRWRRGLLFCLRLAYAVSRDVARGHLTLRAMSLVYTTLLSMVPLLAVSFSVLKAFGVHNQIEPALAGFLAPLGSRGEEITTRVIDFVENIQVGVLGALGLLLLLYTVIALLQKVERAFNETWRVQRPRGFAQRFSDYLSVLLVGPVLIFAALGITASVLGSDFVRSLGTVAPLGALINLATRLVPYVLVIAAFTFVYLFVPNTRVRPLSALVGALVAGVLWQSSGLVFASVIAGSANYTAIYSAFATLIVFMIWLYLSWLILLIGSSIAYYHQHPRRLLLLGDAPELSPRLRERAALGVMSCVAQAHYARETPPDDEALAARLHMPADALQPVVDALREAGLLRALEQEGEPSGYLPGTPPEETPAVEVLAAVRRHGERAGLDLASLALPPALDSLLGRRETAAAEPLAGLTVRDLTERGPGAPVREVTEARSRASQGA